MAELLKIAPEAPRHLPYDIEIEQALLGSVLVDNQALERIGSLIEAEHFYDPLHARIYETMAQAFERGSFVLTPLTLHAAMKADPGLVEVGGVAYLAGLASAAPALPNVRDYARILHDLAVRRSLIRIGEDIVNTAYEAPAKKASHQVISEAESALRSARQNDAVEIPVMSVATLEGVPVPPREFLVEGLIPKAAVTILGGDGGTGKSILALSLAAAMQIGATWLGRITEDGPAIYLSAEDDRAELHRRLAAFAEFHGIPLSKLGALHLLPLAGEDALLATVTPAGTIEPTPLFHDLARLLLEIRPALVVLDTLSDLFGGDENNRVQARQFITLLRSLAMKHDTTILLLAHPSLSGLSNGSGSSGSTAWNNSVRSRLTLERVKTGDGEDDPDLRVLKVKKANYSAVGGEIRLRWDRGVFRLANASTGLATMAAEANADQAFLERLDTYAVQGRRVSASPGPTYAPSIFAADKASGSITKRGFADAMNRLLATGRIRIEETGPASKRRSHLVIAGGKN